MVATLTLAAIFGGPGWAATSSRGSPRHDDGMLFGGVVLVAVLSLVTEATFAVARPAAVSPGLRDSTAEPWASPRSAATLKPLDGRYRSA